MWTDADGLTHAKLVFDDESAAWVSSILDSALRPRRGGPRFVTADEQARAAELQSDPRSNEQLAYDLFLDLVRACSLAEAAEVFGARQAGVRLVQVVEQAHQGPNAEGVAHTEVGVRTLPGWVAAQRGCTAENVTVAIDSNGNPLNVGRARRLFTTTQRIALAVRDGGCRWSGCDRPASMCEAHHIDPWESGGATDIDRGILLCRFHHMQLHNNRWRISRASGENSASGHGPPNFMLHDSDGRATPLLPRIELRYAWRSGPPERWRFLKNREQRAAA